MREKITQKSKSLLLYFSLMLLAVIGSTAYAAEMIAGEGEEASAEATIKSVVLQNGEDVTDLMAGTAVEALIHGSYIVVELENADDVNLLAWEVKFKETGESYKTRSMEVEKGTDGKFSFRISGKRDYELNTGVEYELVFTGWASKDDVNSKNPNFQKSVVIKGGTELYAYSSAKLIEPAELLYNQNEANFSLANAEDNKISFTFSEPVTITEAVVPTGFGSHVNCEVEMSEDKKVATIIVPSSVMTEFAQFAVSILAKGEDGQVVKGNNGEDAESYISVLVDAKFNLPEVTMVDPAPNATVESIKTIKFGYDKGIGASWIGNITILDKTRNEVAKSVNIEQVIPEEEMDNWDYVPTEVIVTFNNEITTSGEYIVNVPEGVFNLDLQSQGFNVKNNHEATFILFVDNDSPMPQVNVTIDPVPGNVASLKNFDITFNDADEAGWGDGFPTLTTPDGTTIVIKNEDLGVEYNELVCNLDEEITEPGEYIFTLPAGCVNLDGNPTTEDYQFKYTIVAAGSDDVTLDPAPGQVTEIPASIKVIFNNEEGISVGTGAPYITNDKGEVFKATLDINYAWELNALELKLTDGAITKNGTYTLTIPAGSVNDTDGNGILVDYTFVYIIGDGNSVNGIAADAENAEVYNAAGVFVGKGVKNLKPGQMYIIKGKKFDVRK